MCSDYNMCSEYVICNGPGREKLVDIVVRTDYALLGILLSVNLMNHSVMSIIWYTILKALVFVTRNIVMQFKCTYNLQQVYQLAAISG